jgi:hypothetical protein
MGEFTIEFLHRLVEALKRNDIEYIVVGGQAIAARVPSYTQDLDVMVQLRSFKAAVAKLRKEPLFGTPEQRDWIAKWSIHYSDWHSDVSDVDMLNGRPYCGTMTPNEFYDYVRDHWTSPGALGPTADPPVVWYTRLLAHDDWKLYARKILRDIRVGAPTDEWMHGVRTIAGDTGTTETIEERIAYLLSELSAEGTA